MQDTIVLVLSQELLWLLCEMIKPDSFACRTNIFLYCDVSMIFNATPIPLQFLYAATLWVIILAKEHSLK